MAAGLRWWVIPGAFVVLLGVLTLGERNRTGDAGGFVGASGSAAGARAHDASGGRSHQQAVLIVAFEPEFEGRMVTLTIWRRIDGDREGTPCRLLRQSVGADCTVAVEGLERGRYDVAVDPQGGGRRVLDDVSVPGAARFPAGR
jgi:hypothetical protein